MAFTMSLKLLPNLPARATRSAFRSVFDVGVPWGAVWFIVTFPADSYSQPSESPPNT